MQHRAVVRLPVRDALKHDPAKKGPFDVRLRRLPICRLGVRQLHLVCASPEVGAAVRFAS